MLRLLLLLAAPRAEDARVLMLGNSYTQANQLHLWVAEAIEVAVPAWSDVLGRALTQGGATLAWHAEQADGSAGDTAWRQALVSGPDAGTWDWVVLQDQSQVPGFPQDDAYWLASRDGAVILDGLIEAGGGETVLLLTWGRRDGDPDNPNRYPDFPTMQARLLEGYQAYADACAADGTRPWILPAGLAYQAVYEATETREPFRALYQEDGSHPSATGSFLVALTTAAALTGRPADDLPAPEGLDPKLEAVLHMAARSTVLDDPFGEISYRWAFDWGDWIAAHEVDRTLSDTVTRPVVRLAEPALPIASLAIGGEEEGSAGELRIEEGASLVIEGPLQLGPEEGWLRVLGGTLSVSELRLGPGGRIEVEGGSLALGDASAGDGDGDGVVILRDGLLSIGGGALPTPCPIGGTLAVLGTTTFQDDYLPFPDARLELAGTSLEAPWLSVQGEARLDGSLAVTLDDGLREAGSQAEVLRADAIDLGDVEPELPAGTELLLHHDDDGDALVLSWGQPCGTCDRGEGGGCGCAGGPSRRTDLAALLLPGLALLARRHRASGPTGTRAGPGVPMNRAPRSTFGRAKRTNLRQASSMKTREG